MIKKIIVDAATVRAIEAQALTKVRRVILKDNGGSMPKRKLDDIDAALIRWMPMLKSQDTGTVMWAWLRGAYIGGLRDGGEKETA